MKQVTAKIEIAYIRLAKPITSYVVVSQNVPKKGIKPLFRVYLMTKIPLSLST
jgi:hypothetical protein